MPLSWWGIVSPPEWVLKHQYPSPIHLPRDPPVINPPRDNVDGRRNAGPTYFEPRKNERDKIGSHGSRNHGDPIQGHYHIPDAFPPKFPNQGWDHPSYGPPVQHRPNGFRTNGGPEWHRNSWDDRWDRHYMARP